MKRRILAAAMAAAMLVSAFAGCQSGGSASTSGSSSSTDSSTGESGGSESTGGATKEHVTLEFIYPQNNPANDWDLVMQKFEEETKDTLNVSINATITGFDDIGQKVSLKLSSGQTIDSIFVAQWTTPTVQSMALKGQLANLDAYFNNDAYPGLQKAFVPDYLNQNKFIGEDNEYHAYAIPFMHEYGGAGSYVYYRKDLAEKYGLGELQNLEDLVKYFDAILENEPGMTPYVSLGMDGYLDIAAKSEFTPTAPEQHNFKTEYMKPSYVIKPDGTAYVSRHIVPWLDEAFVEHMPEGFYNADDPLWEYHAARNWYDKGYVAKDVMNITDHQGLFCNGKAAAFTRGVDTYTAINSQLTSSISGAELGVVNVSPFKDMPKQFGAAFQAWNFAAVPVTSPNVDRVMEFYNWVFEDTANHNLLEYGIEGKHWTSTDDSSYIPQANPDTGKEWNFESYVMTWNPMIRRFDASSPEFVIEELKKGGDADYFYKYADAGFSFNADSIKAVDAKVTEVWTELNGLMNGTVADVEGEVEKINQRLQDAGYAEYAAEYEKQLNDYLADNPYEGQ